LSGACARAPTSATRRRACSRGLGLRFFWVTANPRPPSEGRAVCGKGGISRRETHGTRPAAHHRDRVKILEHMLGWGPNAVRRPGCGGCWPGLGRPPPPTKDTKKSTAAIFFSRHAVRAGRRKNPKKLQPEAARARSSGCRSRRARACARNAVGVPNRVLVEHGGEGRQNGDRVTKAK